MTDLAPFDPSNPFTDDIDDPASSYVAKRLSRRRAFRKAGALGLAGALLLGVGVGAGHAAGVPGTTYADDYTITIRGHGADGLISTAEFSGSDKVASMPEGLGFNGGFSLVALDGVDYAVDLGERAVAIAGPGFHYVPSTVAIEKTEPAIGDGRVVTITADIWDHDLALDTTALIEAKKTTRATRYDAVNHAAELNEKEAAEQRARAREAAKSK